MSVPLTHRRRRPLNLSLAFWNLLYLAYKVCGLLRKPKVRKQARKPRLSERPDIKAILDWSPETSNHGSLP